MTTATVTATANNTFAVRLRRNMAVKLRQPRPPRKNQLQQAGHAMIAREWLKVMAAVCVFSL